MSLADEIEERTRCNARPSVVLIPAAEFALMLDSMMMMMSPQAIDRLKDKPRFRGVELRPSLTLAPNERVWCY